MKSTLLAICVIALFTGCSDGNNAAGNPEAPAAAAPTAADGGTPRLTSVNSAIYDRFPDNSVRFNFPLSLVSDKTATIQNGTTRRGLELAYKNIGADQLWESIDASFNKAGYRATPLKTGDRGKRSQVFVKKGTETVTISTSPDASRANKGVMWASWEVPAAAGRDQ